MSVSDPAKSPATPDEGAGFRRLLVFSSAIGFGAVLGSLALVSRGPAGIQWRLHWAALPLFLIGAVMALLFWRLIYRLDADRDERHAKRRLFRAALGVAPLGVIGFFYPLRFVDPSRRTEVFIGLGIALVVLSGVAVVMVSLIRWLNENEPKDGET